MRRASNLEEIIEDIFLTKDPRYRLIVNESSHAIGQERLDLR